MKKVLFALVAMSLLFTACEDGNDDFIKLKEADDVCTMMDDLELMEHCYEEYDVNKDGKVSMSEAAAVTEIDTYVDRSIKGLEYFINLTDIEILFYEGCTMNLDFRPFKSLKSLDLDYYYGMNEDPIKINLSNNKALEILKISGFTFPQLDLSKLTNLQELELYADINEKIDLSDLSELQKLSYIINGNRGVDLSKNNKLKYLYCWVRNSDPTNPTDLNLNNKTSLQALSIRPEGYNGYITDLDLSQCTELTSINIEDVFVSRLNLANGRNFTGAIVYDDVDLESVPDNFRQLTFLRKSGQRLGLEMLKNLGGNMNYEIMYMNTIYGRWSFTVKNID